MRRMMQSLFALAVMASCASAQSELTLEAGPALEAETCNTCTSTLAPQPPMSGCGNGVGSQLAAYMNAFPTHPNLWSTYSAERSKRLDCLYRHVNDCNCEDPKRNLYAQPSTICSKGCGGLGSSSFAVQGHASFGIAQLNAQPSSIVQTQPAVIALGKNNPMAARANDPRLPARPVAKPANSNLTVKPLR